MRVPQDTDISRRKETRKGVQYEGFIDRVRQLAELDSFSEAERAIKATLTMLGDYLAAGGEERELASELPEKLAEYLYRKPPDRAAPPSLDEFLEEVGEREEVNIDAGAHARAVMMVLEGAVSDKEMEDVRRQLPGEFDPLFD
jgi:uncharacterized protein (DUF2267 family)